MMSFWMRYVCIRAIACRHQLCLLSSQYIHAIVHYNYIVFIIIINSNCLLKNIFENVCAILNFLEHIVTYLAIPNLLVLLAILDKFFNKLNSFIKYTWVPTYVFLFYLSKGFVYTVHIIELYTLYFNAAVYLLYGYWIENIYDI